LAIAPAASISVAFADNVSSGVEPMTAAQWQRHWQDPEGRPCSAWVQGHAFRRWEALKGLREAPSQGWAWLSRISPEHQLAMVAALAPHVDGAISKTLSVPEDTTPEMIGALMRSAERSGLKGISVFRRGSRPGVVTLE
jgi:ribonucleoside-diphosphate reductase alpha chain